MRKSILVLLLAVVFVLISCSSKEEYEDALAIFKSDAPDRYERSIRILDKVPLYFYLSPKSSIRFKNRKWYYKARELKEEIIKEYEETERNYINDFYRNSKLVFVDSDSEELVIRSLDGHDKKKVDFKGTFYKPLWSPNGKYIVFTGMYEDDYDKGMKDDVFIVDRTGENVIRLTHNEYRELSPSWSYDSKKIVFVREKEFSRELITFDLNSFTEKLAFPKEGEEANYEISAPVFLPESYDIMAEFAVDFYIIRNNSTTFEEPLEIFKTARRDDWPELLSVPGRIISRLRFSSDYKKIVFTVGNSPRRGENYIYDLKARKIEKIVGNRRSNLSPDSRYIVFDILDSKYEIHISRRDTKGRGGLPYIKLYEGRDADWSPWLE